MLNNYKITCANGFFAQVASPMPLPEFVAVARMRGFIGADKAEFNLAYVISIEYIGQYEPKDNVTPMGPRLVSGEAVPPTACPLDPQTPPASPPDQPAS